MLNLKKYDGKARRFAPLCLFAFLLFPFAAHAQQDVNARMNRLENDIQTLSRAVFRGEMPPPGDVPGQGVSAAVQADLDMRLTQMEADLRALTGRIEQMDYENRLFQENVEKALMALESGRAAAPGITNGSAGGGVVSGNPGRTAPPLLTDGGAPSWGGTMPPAPETAPPDVPPPGRTPPFTADFGDAPAPADSPTAGQLGALSQSPQGEYGTLGPDAAPADIYEQAFALLRDKNYDGAEKLFTLFLEKHPDDNLAPNAKYWLGETYYVRNNFERAARVFAEAYQQYPKAAKSPDNLLKLALSLAGLGKKEDACLTLGQLKREYASGPGPVLARADREMAGLECP